MSYHREVIDANKMMQEGALSSVGAIKRAIGILKSTPTSRLGS